MVIFGEIYMGKHAYLIIAHNNFYILKKLIALIDDERNDIYIHVDKKTKNFKKDDFINICKKSQILNCKMKLELRNWDKGACPFIPIRAGAGPLFQIFV